MTTILTIIGIIILVCCFGILCKVAGWILYGIWIMFSWAFDGCFSSIVILIVLMFIIGSFIF